MIKVNVQQLDIDLCIVSLHRLECMMMIIAKIFHSSQFVCSTLKNLSKEIHEADIKHSSMPGTDVTAMINR